MAFYKDELFAYSGILADKRVGHLFSTRLGGVSTAEHTKSMNVAAGRGDPDSAVACNIDILSRKVSGEKYGKESAVWAPQIHSSIVRKVSEPGVCEPCDGFITDCPGVLLLVKVADCMPILMIGEKNDGGVAVAAVHAGWRGTASGIVQSAVRMFSDYEVSPADIRCALGPSIHPCCYSVGEDMKIEVASLRGEAFAEEFVPTVGGTLYADIAGMNYRLLLEAGVLPSNIDVSPECTACDPQRFHSHRASRGHRGTMGAMIGIL